MNEEIKGQNFCGTQESPFKMGDCKWPQKRITYYENMNFSGLTRDEVKAIYDQAFKLWADVANIEPVRVDSPDKANVRANTQFMALFAVGVSGLPCGFSANDSLKQGFKSNRTWGKKDLLEVMCHEIGHALGLPHLGSNTIMAAVAMGHDKPQPGDIVEIQKRYGPPVVNPNPTPEPNPDPNPPVVNPTSISKGQTLTLTVEKDKVYSLNFSIPKKGILSWIGLDRNEISIVTDKNCNMSISGKYSVNNNVALNASIAGGSYTLYIKAIESGFLNVTLN